MQSDAAVSRANKASMHSEASTTSWLTLLESRDRLIEQLRYDVPAAWAHAIGQFLDEVRSVPEPVPCGVVLLLLADLARELDRLAPAGTGTPKREPLLASLEAADAVAHDPEALCRHFENALRHWSGRIEPDSLIPEVQAQRIARYIDQHFAEYITVANLARTSGWCGRQLSRAFRTTMRMSIRQYLQTARIEHAAARLRDGDKVESVLAAVGWRGRKNFFHQFKKRLGTTPAQYRECWLAAPSADKVGHDRSSARRLDSAVPNRAHRDRTAVQQATTYWTV